MLTVTKIKKLLEDRQLNIVAKKIGYSLQIHIYRLMRLNVPIYQQ